MRYRYGRANNMRYRYSVGKGVAVPVQEVQRNYCTGTDLTVTIDPLLLMSLPVLAQVCVII